MKIIVASTNPVKIASAKSGFEKCFPNIKLEVTGVSVNSGVSEQPLTDQETLLGATQRCDLIKSQFPNADYWVGIEGGVDINFEPVMNFAWVVVMNSQKTGQSRTGTITLPELVVKRIKSGEELGPIMDDIYHKHNVKQAQGAVGILTDNLITREELYIPSVIMAIKTLT